MSRLGRSQPVQPFVSHGFLGNTPPNGTLPGQILVVENNDRPRRTPPLQPVVINGLYAVVVAPTATPPAAFVVPLDERRRFLAALPAFTTNSALLATTPAAPALAPPAPFVVPVDERGRFRIVLPSTGQHGFVDPGPGPVGTTPPPAQVVPLQLRGRFLVTLPATGQHGFVASGATAAPALDPFDAPWKKRRHPRVVEEEDTLLVLTLLDLHDDF